jgi:CheY-like chemotaxis protein
MEDRKKRILVIEDEEMLLQAISKKLKSSGFDTVTCTNANQALDYLKNLQEPLDVIWLDYYLPDMNGLEFMNEIKKNENWSKIPVVVVSNSASEQKKSSMLALGIKRYVLKAKYRLEDIVSMIKEVIEEDSLQKEGGS